MLWLDYKMLPMLLIMGTLRFHGEGSGWRTTHVKPMRAIAANSSSLTCEFQCKDFQWKMQGKSFVADVFLIGLDTYEMILGIRWLTKLGDITWNFSRLEMKFIMDRRESILNRVPGRL